MLYKYSNGKCGINSNNIRLNSCLHCACMNDSKECVKFLINLDNCKLNVENNNKQTPLIVAIMNGAKESVKLLCENEKV